MGGGSGRARAVVRFGITDFAQDALGDIVYVSLPAAGVPTWCAGADVRRGRVDQERERLYAPVSGVVVARNDGARRDPELVNTDPYGEGWMVEVRVTPGTSRPTSWTPPGTRPTRPSHRPARPLRWLDPGSRVERATARDDPFWPVRTSL